MVLRKQITSDMSDMKTIMKLLWHGVHRRLALVRHRAYPSGMLLLEYEVQQAAEGTNEF